MGNDRSSPGPGGIQDPCETVGAHDVADVVSALVGVWLAVGVHPSFGEQTAL